MEVVVFVPGTMGPILKTPDGQEVWPPTALETQFGCKRKAELMRDDLVVGDIVRSILCVGVYAPLTSSRMSRFASAGAAGVIC